MDDQALLRYGQAAKFICSPIANFGKPQRPEFVFQLEAVPSTNSIRGGRTVQKSLR
jgi:hypothetical protein